MGGAEDGAFLEGDTVLLPDDAVGTLLKVVGRGKWAVKVHGQEKSRVVPSDGLRKYTMKASPVQDTAAASKQASNAPRRYCIVGTWDDWEPHDMNWNADTMCFEYVVTIGRDGCESFKFVQDEDWDLCVHPGRSNAYPGDGHELVGPEDGGLESEWTVGYRPADRAAEGTCHQVRLFLLPDGSPKRVDWSLLTAVAPAAAAAAAPAAGRAQAAVRGEEEAERERERREEERREDAWSRQEPRSSEAHEAGAARGIDLDYEPITRGRGAFSRVQAAREAAPEAKEAVEVVLERERAARERLVERFDQALAVPDSGLAAQQADELAFKLARNRRRYDSIGEPEGLMDPGYVRPRDGTSGENPQPGRGTCVECGCSTQQFWSFGSYCCSPCMEDYNAIVKEGWDGDALIDGKSANDRAKALQPEFNWTAQEARIAVMRLFPHVFRPGAPKQHQPAKNQPAIMQRWLPQTLAN